MLRLGKAVRKYSALRLLVRDVGKQSIRNNAGPYRHTVRNTIKLRYTGQSLAAHHDQVARRQLCSTSRYSWVSRLTKLTERTVTSELYVGLMSGTSLDAIDAVVVSIHSQSNQLRLIASHEQPIPNNLRQQILAICTGLNTTVAQVGLVDHLLAKLYAKTVLELLSQAQLSPKQITAIGNHGQTVFHQPLGETPFTMQLGDANLIAAQTGIDTVADFRRLDMALGGQGAPLVPAFHQWLFKRRGSTTVVLNIGGIANVSVLPTTGQSIGFDTGPGNTLMDAWCERHTGQRYDDKARWAMLGKTNHALLNQLMSDCYLKKPHPKSTGREHYNLDWLTNQFTEPLPARDVQRTLCEFTALSIATQVDRFKHGDRCELLVCGGGAHNPLLMKQLQDLLTNWQVLPTSDRGIPVAFMEAMAFAWLARQRIHNQPSSLPAVTGAQHEISLGVLYSACKEFT